MIYAVTKRKKFCFEIKNVFVTRTIILILRAPTSDAALMHSYLNPDQNIFDDHNAALKDSIIQIQIHNFSKSQEATPELISTFIQEIAKADLTTYVELSLVL